MKDSFEEYVSFLLLWTVGYFITHKKSHQWSFLDRQSCIWNMEIAQICHQYAETREGRQWIPISIERHENNCNSCCCYEDVSLKSQEKECIVWGVCSRRIASSVDNNAAGVLIKSYLVYQQWNVEVLSLCNKMKYELYYVYSFRVHKTLYGIGTQPKRLSLLPFGIEMTVVLVPAQDRVAGPID